MRQSRYAGDETEDGVETTFQRQMARLRPQPGAAFEAVRSRFARTPERKGNEMTGNDELSGKPKWWKGPWNASMASVGTTLAAFGILTGVMVSSFSSLNAGISSLAERLDQTNARIDETNARIDETNARIDRNTERLAERLDQTNERIDETNERLDQTNERLDQTNERLAEIALEVADTKAKVVVLTNDVRLLENEVGSLKGEVGSLQGEERFREIAREEVERRMAMLNFPLPDSRAFGESPR